MNKRELNAEIAKIFGIDPDKAFEATIELRVDSFPIVTVRSWLTDMPEAELTQRFRLAPIDGDEIEVTSLSDADRKFVKVQR